MVGSLHQVVGQDLDLAQGGERQLIRLAARTVAPEGPSGASAVYLRQSSSGTVANSRVRRSIIPAAVRAVTGSPPSAVVRQTWYPGPPANTLCNTRQSRRGRARPKVKTAISLWDARRPGECYFHPPAPHPLTAARSERHPRARPLCWPWSPTPLRRCRRRLRRMTWLRPSGLWWRRSSSLRWRWLSHALPWRIPAQM